MIPDTQSIPTGFPTLDHQLPLYPGGVYLIAGRPVTGKTALGLNLALNWTTGHFQPLPVLYLSGTHGDDLVRCRLRAAMTGISVADLYRGSIGIEEAARIREADRALDGAPLRVVPLATMTFEQILLETWRHGAEMSPRVILVDALWAYDNQHVVFGSKHRAGPGALLRALRWMANSLGAVVLVEAAATRAIERRTSKRPRGACDIKGGRRITDLVDGTFLLHRQANYQPAFDRPEQEFEIEVLVTGKSGQGAGSAMLYFDWATQRISETCPVPAGLLH